MGDATGFQKLRITVDLKDWNDLQAEVERLRAVEQAAQRCANAYVMQGDAGTTLRQALKGGGE
jgi:hypothetical protein